MRLACPNCDAMYEVPEEAIPLEGRDVKCSNCDAEWFQEHPSARTLSNIPTEAPQDPRQGPAAAATESGISAEVFSQPEALAAGESAGLGAETPTAPAPAAVEENDPDFEASLAAALADAVEEAPAPDTPAPDGPTATEAASSDPAEDEPTVTEAPAPLPKRELEDSVRAILREEAQLEAEARRLEAQRLANRKAAAEAELQVQPDLGLTVPPAGSAGAAAAQKRLALLRGESEGEALADAEAQDEPQRPAARRDLLPDVEELTSTLQPTEEEAAPGPADLPPPERLSQSKGFRSGFLLSLVILGLATAVYATADRLAAAYPPAKAPLARYVAAVDEARLWIDSSLEQLTRKMKGQ